MAQARHNEGKAIADYVKQENEFYNIAGDDGLPAPVLKYQVRQAAGRLIGTYVNFHEAVKVWNKFSSRTLWESVDGQPYEKV